MLQKLQHRYVDGWITYSFSWAQYKDPNTSIYYPYMHSWYYPAFHRFSTLNLVLNIKPIERFNILFRFGFASGPPSYITYDDNVTEPVGRGDWDFPTDVKFIWKLKPKGKVIRQVYLAIQNLQAFFILPSWVEGAYDLDGTEDPDSYTADFDIPVPLISFGFEWSY
jgi:hypothetical protein